MPIVLLRIVLFVLSFMSLIAFLGYRRVFKEQSEGTYLGYIKSAANANSIEIAKAELKKAITDIERKKLTSGYTSVLYPTLDENLEPWYKNLKSSFKQIELLNDNSLPPFQKSMVLMNLRVALTDDIHGNKVTHPKGISFHPYNREVTIWGAVSVVLIILLGYFLYHDH